MGRKAKSEREKLVEVIGPDAIEELDTMDEERLVARIARGESEVAECETSRANDEDLETRREAVKTAAGPYRDAIKRLRAIMRYAHLRREELGKV